MLNWRTVLLGIFCVLFVPSISLSQAELSDAEIIKEINASERRTRDHIDTKTESTNTKISEINTKIGTINTNVAVNTTNIGNMQVDINDLKGTVTWIWRGILILIIGSIAIPIGLYFLKQWWENKSNKDSVETVDTTLHELIKELVLKLDVPPLEEVQRRPSSTTFLSEDELRDNLKSDDYATMGKV